MADDYRAQVLQATDIVELIGQSVALRRRGKDFLGLCPFHQEKTPSFHVSPARQFYYCFGCKAGGNAIDFLMKLERIEFREAMEQLGRRAGLEPPASHAPRQNANEKQALLEANSAACRFFENLLWHPQLGRAARDYLSHRGFKDETLKSFQVGLAPDGWDGLLKSEVARKCTPPVLFQAGLLKARNEGGGFYDTFRNRIMFPIRDDRGQIIAFGGRVMPASEDPAKYLNSPETPLFSKGRCCYGLDLARQRIVETRTVAITEGYTDVVMSHQFGAQNVVSVLGTAVTEQHVALLRRFADRIVLLFDPDAAGQAAAQRVVQLFLGQDQLEIAVASIPGAQDPDEFLLEHGLEAFTQLLAEAPDALAYAWAQMSGRFNAEQDLTGRQKAAEEYLQLLAGARGSGPVDGIRWGMALARVSRLTEIPVEELHQRFKRSRPAARPAAPAAPSAPPAEAVAPEDAAEREQEERIPNADRLAESWVLGVLLAEPQRWHDVQSRIGPEDFRSPSLARLARIYWDHQRDEGEPVISELLAILTDQRLRTTTIELVQRVEQLPDPDTALTLEEGVRFLLERKRREQEKRAIVDFGRSQGVDDFARAVLEIQRRDAAKRATGPVTRNETRPDDESKT